MTFSLVVGRSMVMVEVEDGELNPPKMGDSTKCARFN